MDRLEDRLKVAKKGLRSLRQERRIEAMNDLVQLHNDAISSESGTSTAKAVIGMLENAAHVRYRGGIGLVSFFYKSEDQLKALERLADIDDPESHCFVGFVLYEQKKRKSRWGGYFDIDKPTVAYLKHAFPNARGPLRRELWYRDSFEDGIFIRSHEADNVRRGEVRSKTSPILQKIIKYNELVQRIEGLQESLNGTSSDGSQTPTQQRDGYQEVVKELLGIYKDHRYLRHLVEDALLNAKVSYDNVQQSPNGRRAFYPGLTTLWQFYNNNPDGEEGRLAGGILGPKTVFLYSLRNPFA